LYKTFGYYVYILIDVPHIIYDCFNSVATSGVHYIATFQSVFDKTATAYDFVCAMADRIYWLDDTYVQPFYAWAAPRLRDVAISGLFWGLIALIDVALWLADTTRQFMTRDAQAIVLKAFAMAHDPLPELPTLCPAIIPMALSAVVSGLHSVDLKVSTDGALVCAPGLLDLTAAKPLAQSFRESSIEVP
jgi:hypothetical protein